MSSRLPFLAAALLALPASALPQALDAAALSEVVTYAKSQLTTGFLIVQDRRIVVEYNWPLPADAGRFAAVFTNGTDAAGALREDVASAQKSFVAILAGVAIDKGLLDISKPVSDYTGTGWSKATPAQERVITVRNLLEMTSGLTDALAFEAPAGTRFYYNTPAYAVMKPVLEKASGRSLDEITRLWLTGPAGMSETDWVKRPAGMEASGNPTGLYTVPRDIAKMGQVVLDKGKAADGTRIISETQLAALFSRTSTNPAYGHLWWLNGSVYSLKPGRVRTETSLIPAAPAELVAALGAQDRKLYIVPSRKLIVVRMGRAAPDRDFDQQLWLRLIKTRLMEVVPAI